MKQCYVYKSFKPEHENKIAVINAIVEEYQAQGYNMTTRQIYYQLVARGYIENTLQSYKRTANLINDAKLAGMIDWDALEDRTRNIITRAHWNGPASIVRACANQYFEDHWQWQEWRVVVMIEKEALVGTLTDLCHRYDVPLLACRGYPSGTVLREAVHEHVMPHCAAGRNVLVLHLGDHDPSGIDMTRDLRERLDMFNENYPGLELRRIALNMEQIEDQDPPENPAKATDSRYAGYLAEFGDSSWELDALQPAYLNSLVEDNIRDVIDDELWDQKEAVIAEARSRLRSVASDLENDETPTDED